jgi:hypothetical protein
MERIDETKRAEMISLAHELITELNFVAPFIGEGLVMTMGPAPYRRIDCDRRALAYVRARPRKGMVRIDVSGLWLVPRESPLRVSGSGASTTLILRSAEDKTEAIAYLLATVELTRAHQARMRALEEQRRRRSYELRALFRRGRKPLPDGAMIAADAPPKAGGSNGSGGPPKPAA